MIKGTGLLLGLLIALTTLIGAAVRVKRGRQILRELEAKQRCLHCDSNDVRERLDGDIDCASCGQVTSALLLSAKGPSDEELEDFAKPSEHHRLF